MMPERPLANAGSARTSETVSSALARAAWMHAHRNVAEPVMNTLVAIDCPQTCPNLDVP
jgi:hypothetical protein